MTGWRFADRGWFRNDAINVRSAEIRRPIAQELVPPNIVFGSHRWFAGGSALGNVALTSVDDWDAEVARGRPGDNLILISLRQVAHLVIVRAGAIDDPHPVDWDTGDLATIEASDALLGSGELLLVRRLAAQPGTVTAACGRIDLRDNGWPWRQQLEEASTGGGEVWLFDSELDWRDHRDRQLHANPPETWVAQHGMLLVDGYVPDDQGRVVCGDLTDAHATAEHALDRGHWACVLAHSDSIGRADSAATAMNWIGRPARRHRRRRAPDHRPHVRSRSRPSALVSPSECAFHTQPPESCYSSLPKTNTVDGSPSGGRRAS